jgi:hypothetical protein
MASTYSTLKLELIPIGETGSTGNWGTTTNNNLGDTTSTLRGIEQAIGGYSAVTLTTTSTTLAYTNTTANQNFRSLFLDFSGAPGAASTVIIPSTSIQKLYVVKNGISGGYSITVKYSASTGTVVPNGKTIILYANGSDVIPGQDYIPALTLGSALPVASGGTGITSFGTGIATWLGTPSSANLAAAVTDETGSGSLVFGTAPTLSAPVLTSPSLSAETFSTSATVTAGTDAQGQGALTSDYSVVTTAATNPSGVTLPAATTGRRVVVVNKGANPINVYPATSAYIDALAINSSIQISVNGVMIFNASSTTQWYSSYNLMTPSFVGAVNSFSAGTTGFTPSTATTGAVTLSGTLNVLNGGTGVTTSTGSGSVVLSNSPTIASPTLTTPALGTPASGTLTSCTGLPVSTGISGLGTGIATFLATPSSANLAAAVTDETGSGALVFGTSPTIASPTLTTPALGTPASGTLTSCTGLPVSTGISGLGTNVATALAVNTGAAGAVVVNGGVLGTPSSGTLTNCTSLPISTGVSGLGTNVATFLATPTSANLAAAVTDETGSGALVFATSPTLVTPALGTPSSGTLTNCTSLPISTGVSGLGTSVATALAVNVGSAGAVVVNGGALGTPSSGTLTSCTGLPISTGVSGLGTGVATFLATPSSANLATAVTDETGSGSLVFGTSPTLSNPTITGYTETTVTANTGSAYTINIANGTLQILTLTGNCTYTFPTATAGKSFTLFQLQDATGSRTVTWGVSVRWPNGTTPTLTSTASKGDKFVFTADGTYWWGTIAGQNYL